MSFAIASQVVTKRRPSGMHSVVHAQPPFVLGGERCGSSRRPLELAIAAYASHCSPPSLSHTPT